MGGGGSIGIECIVLSVAEGQEKPYRCRTFYLDYTFLRVHAQK